MPDPTGYSGNPAASPADEVWFLIGDTAATATTVTYAEITYLLAEEGGDTYLAAARAAEQVAAKAADEVTRSMGSLSISLGEKAANFSGLARSLRAEAAKRGGHPELTAESKATKKGVYQDNDRVASEGFRLGMHDLQTVNPATGAPE